MYIYISIQDSTYSFTGATTGFGGATAYYHPLWLFLVPNCFFVFLPDGQISFRPVWIFDTDKERQRQQQKLRLRQNCQCLFNKAQQRHACLMIAWWQTRDASCSFVAGKRWEKAAQLKSFWTNFIYIQWYSIHVNVGLNIVSHTSIT